MRLFGDKKKDDLTIIVGCGRLGSSIANQLSANDVNVVVVDDNQDSFRRLSTSYGGLTFLGDATDIDILKELNMASANQVIVVTENDNVNIFVGQMAKVMFNVPKVIVRVYDNDRQPIYAKMGIETICPAELSAEAVNIILGGALECNYE